MNNPARANQSGFGKVGRLKRLSASKFPGEPIVVSANQNPTRQIRARFEKL